MIVPGSSSPLLMGGADGYQISRSVRTRASASAYFNRTLTTPTGTTKWTWSGWVKRGSLGSAQTIFSGSSDVNNWGYFGFLSGDTLTFSQADAGSVTSTVTTTQVFRDPSAWYHIVVVFDTTQATAANRLQMYINGSLITAFGTASYLAQNTASRINTANAHQIYRYFSAANYVDGYLAETYFIDGQALTPTSFGAFDAVTGVWNPIRYSGTYGNNGFYLNFSDNSAATATTIGKDSSGNGNNWTPNNISVTAGTTYDSMVDVPINWGTDTGVGGEVRGSYCTGNPLWAHTSTIALSNGNLTAVWPGYWFGGTIGISTGKWYWEFQITAGTVGSEVGIASITRQQDQGLSNSTGSNAYGYKNDGTKFVNTTFTSYGASYTTNDIVGVAFDATNTTITFYKNGVSQGSAFTNIAADTYLPAFGNTTGSSMTAQLNFGQRAFAYTAPSGYKALCTQNLPVPTILNGANYMAASLYTGTGASQTISNAVNSISFQPDLVWIKSRSAATDNKLTDSVRGTTKALISNTTGAETTDTNGLTAFGASGFTVGTDTVYNNSGATYVGWNWKGGGTAVTNTAGSVTATVSANTTAGFSIIKYTTPASGTCTVGHGLGVAPAFFMQKETGAATNWSGYHSAIGATKAIQLNTTSAAITNSVYWNNTDPTSTVITIGSGFAGSYAEILYAFAPIAGFSAFGSYTGNGSTDGPFVYCGFRPRFVLWKRSDSTGSWYIQDTSRNPYNQATLSLYPNLSDAETSGDDMDYLSNGFKVRDTFSYINASGGTFLYAAFAENPFTIARAR